MLFELHRLLGAALLRTLNQRLEPLVEAGFGSPGLCPVGAIVVETVGRKTGRALKVTLTASSIGDLVVVHTIRIRSQWVRNLARTPAARYWMNGCAHDAVALVVAPDFDTVQTASSSSRARCIAESLRPISRTFGVSFAILSPTVPRESRREGDA